MLTVYWGVVFGSETFVLRDALRFTLPSREFLSSSLRRGRVPQWWDGVGFGVAFASNPVHAVVSPVSWVFAPFPTPWTFDLRILGELLLLSLGAAALARRLGSDWIGAFFSAFAVVLSGYTVSAVSNSNTSYLVWIPWVAWSALARIDASDSGEPRTRARAGALFAALVALQLLSGEPGHILVAAIVVLAVVVAEGPVWRRFSSLLLPGAAGAGLASAGVFPALLLFGQSARARPGAAGPLMWSMPPGRILEWVWPLPFGSEGNESWFAGSALGLPTGDPCFALSLYVGLPVFVLAAAAGSDRRTRRLLLASIAFVILALGSYTPVYGALRFALPPLRAVNFPEKFFFGALLLWCTAAGVGLKRILDARPRGWLTGGSVAFTALLAAGGAAAHLCRFSIESWLGPRAAGVNLDAGLSLCVAGASIAALGAALFTTSLFLAGRSRLAAAALAVSGMALPLVFAARAVTPLAERALVQRTPRALEALPPPPLGQKDARPRLFLYPTPHIRPALATGEQIAADIHENLDTNVAARFGYDVIPGFETGDSVLSRKLWEEISARMSFLAFVRLIGVDFAMVPDPERFAPGWPVLARLPGWGIVETFPVRPRAFVAPRSATVPSVVQGLESLAWQGRERDPARVVLSGEAAEALEAPGPLEPCAIRSRRPEEVLLDCRSSSGGYAVLLDENLPGWSAELDGRPARILTADGLFRAVRVEAGAHRIAFRYRTPGLRAGAIVSLLTLALVALVVLRSDSGEHRG